MKRHTRPLFVIVVSMCCVAAFAGQAMGQATSFTSMGYRANEAGGGGITSAWTTGNLGNTWSEGEWVPYQLVIENVQTNYPGLAGLPDIVMSYDFTKGGIRFVDLVRSIQVGTTELTDLQGWPMTNGSPYPDDTRPGIEAAQNDVGNPAPFENEWTGFDTLSLPFSQINRASDGGLNHPDSAESTFRITLADLLAVGLNTSTETIVIYYQLHESRSFVWSNSLQSQYDAFPTDFWGGYLYSTGAFPGDSRLGAGYVPGSSGHIEVEFATGSKTVPIPIPETLPGEVTGLKWHDYDGDGAIDGGEPTIADWPIHVSGMLENIFFEASTTTDGSGNYAFPNLTSGVTWTLKEDSQLPPDDTWSQTYPLVSTTVGQGTGVSVFPPPPGVADIGWEVELTLLVSSQPDIDFGNRLCELTCIDPPDTTVSCNDDTSPASLGMPIVEGNCTPIEESYSDDVSGSCPTIITRTWTFVDVEGNECTSDQIITIDDDTPPVIACPPDAFFDCVMGDPGVATATDNCYLESLTSSDNVTNSSCPYVVERTWTAVDSCGNESSCIQTITVEDTEAPVIACPPDAFFDCVMGDPGVATATDNCYLESLTSSDNVTNSSCPYVVERTWTAVDSCGNESSCIQTITVEDTEAPVIACPPDAFFDCVMGDPGVATATDNCYLESLTSSDNVTNSSCPYVVERTWTAVDSCGNESSCIQTITVEDTEDPVFTFCPTDTVMDCENGGDYGTAEATDNCYVADLSFDDVIINERCPLVVVRTWTATDSCGNTAQCTQNITIQDTTRPVVTCPPNARFECEMGDAGEATAWDECAGDLTPTYSDRTTQTSCPIIIERTWSATDTCGNSASCVQTITIEDTTPPVVTCPPNARFECEMGDAGEATAWDECAGDLTPTYSDRTTQTSCPIIIERTWSATDTCGNSASCVQTITIEDTTPPVVTCPPDARFECVMGDAGEATAWDECAGDLTPTSSDRTTQTSCPIIIERTWTATDTCGNSASCVQTITIEDTTPPVVTCPPDAQFECEFGDPGVATAVDACGGDITPTSNDVIISESCPYEIERTWTATDTCGNSASCVQIITVTDTTAPVVTCPPDAVFECEMGDAGEATAWDDCIGDIVPTFYDDTTQYSCPIIIERTWTAVDYCGNADSCVQTITIRDTTKPELTIPAHVVYDCEMGEPGVATAFDICGGELIPTFADLTVSNSCPIIIERTWTAVDTCGNRISKVQNITVQDTVKPVLTIPRHVVYDCEMGEPGVATAVDLCGGELTPTFVDLTVSEGCPYQIERTWTVVDTCGNEVSLVQNIMVQDTAGPTILTCAEDTTVDCESEVVFTPPTAEDSCVAEPELIVLPVDTAMGTNPGDTIFTQCWVFVDTCGNESDTCCQAITKEACPQEFCTFTMGGWGSGCPESQFDNVGSEQPGCIRDNFFDYVFPNGVTLGHTDYDTVFFSSAGAVEYYLPAGGKPASLPGDLVDPSSKEAGGVLGGQILALTLNREFSAHGIFGDLFDHFGFFGGFEIPDACGMKFAGLTVDSFLVIANNALGGNVAVLDPFGAKLSDVSYTATCLNELFNDCEMPYAQVFFGDENNEVLPMEYGLDQNYPNPFNPSTEFSFTLPKPSHVRLEIYNIIGQRIHTLTEGQYSAGRHTITWDSGNRASGIYFYRLATEDFVATKKMVLLK